jgi:rhamnose utilization protein RhaD (predicted bifunctional aldolase and dehydrogenase)
MDNVLQQLAAMTRFLGAPENGFAMLGEGNTAARIEDDVFYVKASGTSMGSISEDGFVKLSISKVLEVLDDPNAGDDAVTENFKRSYVDPNEQRRPSTEAMLHAILLQIPEFVYVGHTHPVYTNALLCSDKAEEAMAGRLFPDHIVSMKHKSVYVPYVDPGLVLAREVRDRLHAYIEEEGVLPSAIVMQNHGLICMGDSPKAVTSCTMMAEKAHQILVAAYAVGKPAFMPKEHVDRIFTRPDELYRLGYIAADKK